MKDFITWLDDAWPGPASPNPPAEPSTAAPDAQVPISEPPGSLEPARFTGALFTCARCPAVTVTLEAGGAGTYDQRAIPGSEPGQDSCTFLRCDPDLLVRSIGQTVQRRPSVAAASAVVPQLSRPVGCGLPRWQQYWQQSRRDRQASWFRGGGGPLAQINVGGAPRTGPVRDRPHENPPRAGGGCPADDSGRPRPGAGSGGMAMVEGATPGVGERSQLVQVIDWVGLGPGGGTR